MTAEFTLDNKQQSYMPNQTNGNIKVILPTAKPKEATVTVVVPAMNEAENLRVFLPQLKGMGYEILLVLSLIHI